MTPVEVCNRALALIPTRSTISSLTENSAEARLCSMYFEATRDELLRLAPWDFAKTSILGQVFKAGRGTPENPSTVGIWNPLLEPVPPWRYSYVYPQDCLRVRYIKPSMYATNGYSVPIFGQATRSYETNEELAYRFSKASDLNAQGERVTVILTDVSTAIITYTAIISDVNQWDGQFNSAMEVSLAAAMCVGLSGNAKQAASLEQRAAYYVNQARITDGNEGLDVYDQPVDWITIRSSETI